MSVATRRAIYGKLSGDTTLNNLLGTPPTGFSKSIFYQLAPEKATNFPYVIFTKQAGTPTYAMAGVAMNAEIWTIKGVDHSTDSDIVDTISSRLDALLTDATLSISGNDELYLRRESDVDYSEVTNGERYIHSGAMFRLVVDPT